VDDISHLERIDQSAMLPGTPIPPQLLPLKESNMTEIKKQSNLTTEYISVSDVALILGISIFTVRAWIRQGRIPAIGFGLGQVRRHYKIKKTDFEQFLKELQVVPQKTTDKEREFL
jgi:excisionase family DNA binding protein